MEQPGNLATQPHGAGLQHPFYKDRVGKPAAEEQNCPAQVSEVLAAPEGGAGRISNSVDGRAIARRRAVHVCLCVHSTESNNGRMRPLEPAQ